MSRILSAIAMSAAVTCAFSVVACSGDDPTAGKSGSTQQELKKKQDGSPTGNGTTCSWEGTGQTVAVAPPTTSTDDNGTSASPPYEGDDVESSAPGQEPQGAAGNDGTTASLPSDDVSSTVYPVGQTFKSPDGCNDCSCSPNGIVCTVRACAKDPPASPPSTVCPAIAILCPDGKPAKTGPNCELICATQDEPVTPDGSSNDNGGICPQDAKKCPDGSYVARTGPKCQFAACPKGK